MAGMGRGNVPSQLLTALWEREAHEAERAGSPWPPSPRGRSGPGGQGTHRVISHQLSLADLRPRFPAPSCGKSLSCLPARQPCRCCASRTRCPPPATPGPTPVAPQVPKAMSLLGYGMSWSSAINNLRATGSARTREGNGVPTEPPLLGLQSPKLPGGCKSWGGISQFPKLGLCPGGHPKTLNGASPGLGGALRMPGWTRWDAEPHVPPARAQGDVLGGGFSLPDTAAPCLSSWPGNGASPSRFFHLCGSGCAPPARKTPGRRVPRHWGQGKDTRATKGTTV